MKRINTVLIIFTLLFSTALTAQEENTKPLTVAVMDSQLAQGIPYNLSPLTANYVSDTLFRLGKYKVIPRGEIYFGYVGAPSSEIDINHLLGRGDYAELGNKLKADLICLLKVEERAGRYTLTGEMIQAQGGVILSTEQTESEGLLGMIDASKLMGEKLSGSQLTEGEKKTPVLMPVTPPSSDAEPAPPQEASNSQVQSQGSSTSTESAQNTKSRNAKENDSKPTAFGSMTLGVIIPEFFGSAKSVLKEDDQLHTLAGSVSDMTGGSVLYDLGLNINFRIAGDSFFYLDLGMNYSWEWIEYEPVYSYSLSEGDNFMFLDFYLGPGVVLPLGHYFQAAAGFTLGYGMLEFNNSLWDNGSEIAGGVTLGINVGIDARLPGDFIITLRYMAIIASELDVTGLVDDNVIYYGDTDFGFNGIQIGIGTVM